MLDLAVAFELYQMDDLGETLVASETDLSKTCFRRDARDNHVQGQDCFIVGQNYAKVLTSSSLECFVNIARKQTLTFVRLNHQTSACAEPTSSRPTLTARTCIHYHESDCLLFLNQTELAR